MGQAVNRVVVVRSFDEPVSVEELTAAERAVAFCFEERGVRWLKTFVSFDGRRMICLYDALDAESVRHTQNAGGLSYDAIWSGRVLEAAPPPGRSDGYSLVVVERDLPPGTTLEQYEAAAANAAGCLQSHRVHFVESVFGGPVGHAVCAFFAPDAEAVRIANLESGLPMLRAWSSKVHLADAPAT